MPNGASIDTYESFVQSKLPPRMQDHILVTASAGSEIKTFPVSSRGWFNIVEEFRRSKHHDTACISDVLWDPFYDTKQYLGFCVFLPNCFGGRAEDNFFEDVAKNFPDKKIYVFGQHGFINGLLDSASKAQWRGIQLNNEKICDTTWTKEANGFIRVSGYPRLTRWVQL